MSGHFVFMGDNGSVQDYGSFDEFRAMLSGAAASGGLDDFELLKGLSFDEALELHNGLVELEHLNLVDRVAALESENDVLQGSLDITARILAGILLGAAAGVVGYVGYRWWRAQNRQVFHRK